MAEKRAAKSRAGKTRAVDPLAAKARESDSSGRQARRARGVRAKGSAFEAAPALAVGVGASAGGLSALRSFFQGLSDRDAGDLGSIAFVVLQHLDEAGGHLARESLARLTTLPVEVIRDGSPIRGGTVFHAPPRTEVALEGGVFRIRGELASGGARVALIDAFLRSLAKDRAESAIAVILSGEGSDGALGLKAVTDAGGIGIAQLPATAEYPAMPTHALATGAADDALSPGDAARRILGYARAGARAAQAQAVGSALSDQVNSALVEICEILFRATRHDFKHYKTSTLNRRIQRRMKVLQIASVGDYLEKLSSDGKEIDALFKELLINVTAFFRDREAFRTLAAEVLRPALKSCKPGQKYRIWVAGCSTGEEAYSMAMLAREIAATMRKPPAVQIIATDIDEAALAVARKGAYPAAIAAQVSPSRLRKHFVKKGARYVASLELREMVLFSSHNLINDPPFSQIDLISCRNVLIYLGPHLQKKLIPVFHYALRAGGHLFLGASESLAGHRELFRTVSAKQRIAQRKATAVRPPGLAGAVPHSFVAHQAGPGRNHEADLHLVGQRILLDEFAPKYAVVNDDCRIVSASSGLEQYFEIAEGAFQNNLARMVKSSLRVGLRSAFAEAKKRKRKVTRPDLAYRQGDGFARVSVTVQPMPQLGDESELYFVAFQSQGAVRASKNAKARLAAPDDAAMVEQLERELSAAREDLDRSVQDLEASNEELKSSNEELLSMNEELQSANEELEASKEEVQGANEALQRSNSDLENLLSSTEIATLFLDEQGRIQNFTPQLASIYKVSRVDLGRELGDIASRAKEMPLLPGAADVSARGMIEHEIELLDGRRVLRRVTRYRTAEGEESGLVATFVDVTRVHRAEERRRATEERFRTLTEIIPQLVWTCLPDGRCDYLSRQWVEYTGIREEDQLGLDWLDRVIHPDDRGRVYEHWMGAVEGRHGYDIEYRIRRRDGDYRWFQTRGTPMRGADGKIERWFGTCTDVHDMKLAQERISADERRLRMMISTSPSFMCLLSGDDNVFAQANDRYLELIGRRDVIGKPLLEALPEVEGQGFSELLERVRATGEPFVGVEMPVVLTRTPGAAPERRYLDFVYQPSDFVSGEANGVFVHGVDVTEKVEARAAIENERENFRNLFRQTPEMVCILSGPDHLFEFVNEAHERALGFNAVGMTVRQAQPESVEVHGILDEVYRTGKTAELVEIPVTVGDRLRYFNLTYAARRDREGKIDGIMILGTEVTEDLLHREGLRLQGEALELALSNAPIRSVLDVLGKMIEKQIGGGMSAVILLAGEADRGASSAARQGLAAVWSAPIQSSGGRLIGSFALLARAPRVPTPREAEMARVAAQTAALILERKTEIEERMRAAEEAERANLAKTRFLANMSHEIRTPLSAVVGFSDLLRSKMKSDPETNSFIERISRNAAQLGRLIDELLDLSKIEADKLEIERAAVDVDALIEDVTSAMMLRAQDKKIDLTFHWSTPKPARLVTDPLRLSQILINVVGNAVKFTERGSVAVELSAQDGLLRARVSDTGIGLSEEQQTRIFQPFMQADASVTRKYGGTGLGLALAKKLAELLGGTLELERSAPGEGSTFVISVATELAESRQAPRVPEIASTVPTGPETLRGKSILVVDDSPDNRAIVGMFLRSIGASVSEAVNGAEGTQAALARGFDLVLMDIQMPVMDGYHAVAKLRQGGFERPVVALTAHAFKDERDRCLSAGFSGYVTKPISRASLLQTVCELLLSAKAV